MTDSDVSPKQVFTLKELAEALGAEFQGDPQCEVNSVATLVSAGVGQVSFLANKSYKKYLSATEASIVILHPDNAQECPTNAIILANPYLGFAKVLSMFHPKPESQSNVHPSAIIDTSAQIGTNVEIGPNVVLGAETVIGDNVKIAAGVSIGDGSTIGSNCHIYPNTVIYHGITLGDNVTVHSGVIIGSDGFGFANDVGKWIKVPQVGGVKIGNNVEIGANTTIDRGALEDTVVEDGVILDNQIQIGHNVVIGANTAIAGCAGIAGSTKIGRNCLIGGAATINGHIEIGDGVILLPRSAVHNSISKPGVYSSETTVHEFSEWKRNNIRFRQLNKMAKRLSQLEGEIKQLNRKEVQQ